LNDNANVFYKVKLSFRRDGEVETDLAALFRFAKSAVPSN
jgi:hypothetical protein